MLKIPVLTCFRGGPAGQKDQRSAKVRSPCWAMLALFFALGRFLAAFCNSCCVCCRSWPVLVGPGTLRARFWRVPGGSGEGLGGPKAVFCDAFSRLQSCNAKPARKAFRIGKTNTKLGFLHIVRNAPTSKNDAKSFQKPFAQHFPKKAC